jgi:RNA-directed DNA polymerase
MSAVSARSIREARGLDPVRALQWVLYRSAKSDPARRFHALYGQVARSDVLGRAWADVRANRGAPGVDGVRIADVESQGVAEFLNDLAARLRDRSYRPARLRRVHIPKPGRPGESRPLGIPTVADRVVMTAAKIVLEPIFEADFSPDSYGFRPRRSALDACEAIRSAANQGRDWVLDADIRDCFGSLDHDALMATVAERVTDRAMLQLIRSWLRAGVCENGVTTDTGGTPQGSPISPLLANIALNRLDRTWAERGQRLGVLVRYADDIVALCPTEERACQAHDLMASVLGPLGLHLHPGKTRIVSLRTGAQGFDFLGFHHHKVESWRWRGRYYLQRWPSARAMTVLRGKVREATSTRQVGRSLDAVVADLNPVLRGWAGYFRHGNSARKFSTLDSYVHERLALFDGAKRGRSGREWGRRHDGAWFSRLGVYRLSGTVRPVKVHA